MDFAKSPKASSWNVLWADETQIDSAMRLMASKKNSQCDIKSVEIFLCAGYGFAMKNFKTVTVNDKMQRGYSYELVAEMGIFPPEFQPALTPPKMLELGVFEGKYLNDCRGEFPASWYENARISDRPNIQNNYFKIKSRQPLSVWKEKGWIIEPDPRGWFQWYCRYYLGRRIPAVDAFQIKRWRAFTRHKSQVEKNCDFMDLDCRPRQRQALLQWAYDPFF